VCARVHSAVLAAVARAARQPQPGGGVVVLGPVQEVLLPGDGGQPGDPGPRLVELVGRECLGDLLLGTGQPNGVGAVDAGVVGEEVPELAAADEDGVGALRGQQAQALEQDGAGSGEGHVTSSLEGGG